MIELRDYQKAVQNDIYKEWQTYSNIFVAVPTGGGKSVIVSKTVSDFIKNNCNCAVIAHRNELVSQMSVHLGNLGIYHRIIGSAKTVKQITKKHRKIFGRSYLNPSSMTAVVGVDTLLARKNELKHWAEQIDLWITDEAHHVTNDNKWGTIVEMFINARGLGVSATPTRTDGKGLGRNADGYFDKIVLGPSMRWLIDNNFLCDYEIVCPLSDLKMSISDVGKTGDWSTQKLKKASKESRIVGDVVEAYVKYASGKKAIVFTTDIETADKMSKKFNDNGIKAASVNGKSETNYREQCVDSFASSEENTIQVLINVNLFDEGFDVPGCEVVIMARPTTSLGKYLQMIGRALRYKVGKTALIIDLVSNVIMHGLPDKNRVWSLERNNKKAKQLKDPDEIPLTICPICSKPYEKFRTKCPYCGAEKPLPEPQNRSLEVVEGDLILLDKKRLEEMRRNTELEAPVDLARRVGYVAGPIAAKAGAKRQVDKINAQNDLIDVINQWAGIERWKGFEDREIYKKFYYLTGLDVLSALSGSNSRQDYENLTNTIRSWYEK